MARIRSVKPDLRRSLTVAAWPREVRYAWVLLWGYLDDEGRGVDETRLLVADLFPLDHDVAAEVLDEWLWVIVDSGPLCRYHVDGRDYLHAVHWAEHQKPNRPRSSELPPCPRHEGGSRGSVRACGWDESAMSRQEHDTDASVNGHAFPTASPAREADGERSAASLNLHGPVTDGAVPERGAGSREGETATPPAAAPARPLDSPPSETRNQRANRLTRGYHSQVRLSNFPAVARIVAKATDAGYSDEQITAGLDELAAEGRSVTTDTLRYAMDGPPAARTHNRLSTADERVAAGLALASKFANQEAQ